MVLYATIGASGSAEVVLKVLVIMHYERRRGREPTARTKWQLRIMN